MTIRQLQIVFCFGIWFWVSGIDAQTRGSISGSLVDSLSGEPLAFANVVLILEKDGTIKQGVTTDEQGDFHLDNLAYGTYLLEFSYVGYPNKQQTSLRVRQEPITIGKVNMSQAGNLLNEVVITSQRNEVETTADGYKIIPDEARDAGTSAAELAQKLPGVQVDENNRITSRGSKVTILIDGVPAESDEILEQLPSDAVEDMELITTPSAKYSGRAGGAVLNIRTKSLSIKARQVRATLGANTQKAFNASLYGNYRQGKWGLSGISSRNNDLQLVNTNTLRLSETGNRNSFEEDQDAERESISQFHRANISYTFSKANTLKSSVTLRKSDRNFASLAISDYYQTPDAYLYRFERDRDDDNISESLSADLSYSHKWNDDKELRILASARNSFNDNTNLRLNQQYQADLVTPRGSVQQNRNINEITGSNWQLNMDFENNLSKAYKMEAGAELSIQSNRNQFQRQSWDPVISDWFELPIQSVRAFDFHIQSYETYGVLKGIKGKWSGSVGLRPQYQIMSSAFPELDSVGIYRFFQVIPSLAAQYRLHENWQYKISYSKRTRLPDARQLSPFDLSASSLYTTVGNPNLRPEVFHAAETGISYTKQRTSFSAALFARQTNDLIDRLVTVNEDGTILSQFNNISTFRSVGLELTSGFPATRIGRIQATVSGYRSAYLGFIPTFEGEPGTRRNWGSTSRLNTNWNVHKNASLQVNFRYDSPQITFQGKRSALFNTDVALKTTWDKKKWTFTLRANDVFNTASKALREITYRPDFDSFIDSRINTQYIHAGISYSFSKYERIRGEKKKGKK